MKLNGDNERSFVLNDIKQLHKRVVLSNYAFDQYRAMAQLHNKEGCEFTAYAPVLNKNGELYIPKLYATTQKNTAVETIAVTDPEMIIAIENDFPDDPEILSKVKVHVHSHPKGINSFSAKDDQLAEGWFNGDEDFLIMLMITEEFKTCCRIEVYLPFRTTINNVKLEVETSNEEEIEEWKNKLKSKRVKPEPITYTSGNRSAGFLSSFPGKNSWDKRESIERNNNGFGEYEDVEFDYSYEKEEEAEFEFESVLEELKYELELSYSIDMFCKGCGLEYNDYEIAIGQCSGKQCSQIIRPEDFAELKSEDQEIAEEIIAKYEETIEDAEAIAKASGITSNSKKGGNSYNGIYY